MQITKSHYQAFVSLLGLTDEWDIFAVHFDGKAFQIALANGADRVLFLSAVESRMQLLAAKEQADAPQEEVEALTVTMVHARFNGMYRVEMVDAKGNASAIIQRRLSSVIQKGSKVYIDNQRRLNLLAV